MVKGPGYADWDYRVFALDVPGMSSIPLKCIKSQELNDIQASLDSISKAVMLLQKRRNRALKC